MNGPRKTTRRQFLKGKAALDALSDLQFGPAEVVAPDPWGERGRGADREAGNLLMQVGRRAMACQFQVLLNAGQHGGAVEAAMQALDLIDQLEAQMSVYRPESEISYINEHAADEPVAVESQLFSLLRQCAGLAQETGGAFDITAGPLVQLWGFLTRQGRFPSADQVRENLLRVGSEKLVIEESKQTVFFQHPGMELNLGSIGKGYALDRCAALLEAAGVKDYLIHGGHSSILARGSRVVGGETSAWRVALRHPLRPARRLAEIRVRDQALGTSGSGQQFFYHHGRRYGHVLDPRTGSPAEGVLSATVLAPTAAQADALATAFFVLGVEAAEEYCAARPGLAAIFVLPGQRQGTVALESFAMDDQLVVLEDAQCAPGDAPSH